MENSRERLEAIQSLRKEVKDLGSLSLDIITKFKHFDYSRFEIEDALLKAININKRCHTLHDKLRILEGEMRNS